MVSTCDRINFFDNAAVSRILLARLLIRNPLASKLRARVVTAILAIALIASSAYVVSELNSLTAPVPNVRLVKPFSGQREPPYGTLSIDVLLGIKETFYGANSLPAYFKPIAGEKVSISLSNYPSATQLVLVTNASGLVGANLPISNYYVATIRDTRFHVTIPFSIFTNTTTSIVLKAVRHSSPVLFDEIYDASPGANATTQTLFLKIHPTTDFSNSSLSVFLERTGLGAKNFVDPKTNASVVQMPVKILEEFADQGGLWVQLLADQSGDRQIATKLFLVTYIPVYTEAVGSK